MVLPALGLVACDGGNRSGTLTVAPTLTCPGGVATVANAPSNAVRAKFELFRDGLPSRTTYISLVGGGATLASQTGKDVMVSLLDSNGAPVGQVLSVSC